eukprot:TRINITY_DN44165_c0_g3_i3.p1 TRINITY_DN44165_c0_g3~~TRINITY_DN44165_c0_g3_i3.p1  ORF type:complete len:844 (+),score=196.60 TRINITY_DN44165_c0_g3_i3:46-2577(+)
MTARRRVQLVGAFLGAMAPLASKPAMMLNQAQPNARGPVSCATSSMSPSRSMPASGSGVQRGLAAGATPTLASPVSRLRGPAWPRALTLGNFVGGSSSSSSACPGGAVRCQSTSSAASSGSAPPAPDKLEWLEEVQGEKALGWVKEQNKQSVGEIGDPKETETYRRILAILDSKEKIPYVGRLGKWYYNFWQDDKHQKGLWRRTTLESYKTATPKWETVLDLDELSKTENTTWVWKGYDALDEGLGAANKWDRVLLSLSPGGSDATVVREFDLEKMAFVSEKEGGFVLPEAKSSVRYRTRDELLVGTDFGEGSLTNSGYPRVIKSWRRGTPLSSAVTVFEGIMEDVAADNYMYHDRGHWHDFQYRALDFYRSTQWYRPGCPTKSAADKSCGEFVKIPVPDDAGVGTFGDAATISLRSDWQVAGRTYKSGSLLSLPLSKCVAGDFSDMQILFEPTERTSLQGSSGTKNYMVLSVLNNVRAEMQYWKYQGAGKWVKQEPKVAGGGVPVGCDVQVSAVWPEDSDDIWIIRDGYLQPDTLQKASAQDCGAAPEDLKAKPAMFNSAGLMVEQLEATSADGTKIPYFVMRRKDAKMDGSMPTLLDGYGGFEIPLTPGYSAGVGAGWLERGGAKVIANIRGGGEFGPSWHQSALREKRHKAYEDFEAVAKDLINRGVTSPGRLACIGGSNGGLLVGNMLTREGAKLFGAVVCQVPLLDMWKYHKLLAGASWMAEYGDPDKPEDWEFLRRHSPYHRLHEVCLQPGSDWTCPQVLFTTSTKDDRVHPGHARKMVRRLLDDVPRERAPKVLYWENIEGGHGGAADNKQRAFMWSLTYEFLWQTIAKGSGQSRL